MHNIVALFDLDGTLCRGHIWKGFHKYYTKYRKRKMPSLLVFMITHMALWLLVKCKLLSREKYILKWAEDFNNIFKGASKKEIFEISQWVVDNYLTELLRSDIVNILQQHKQQGHIVLLISATIRQLLEIVGQRLGVSNIIGTELEIVDDIYSGKVSKPICFGEGKAKLFQKFINQNDLNVDLSSSFAYADSIFDISLLKLVGHPIATYPDKNLQQFAENNGWQLLP